MLPLAFSHLPVHRQGDTSLRMHVKPADTLDKCFRGQKAIYCEYLSDNRIELTQRFRVEMWYLYGLGLRRDHALKAASSQGCY